MLLYLVPGVVFVLAQCVLCSGVPAGPAIPCDRGYAYCEGHSFKAKLRVKNRIVLCDLVPEPKQNCCLPQIEHYVCYNIRVDGNKLNFDASDPMDTTNFESLCEVMLTEQGKKEGKSLTHGNIDTVYKADGAGTLRYKFGAFELANTGETHIKHLACGIQA